MQLKIKTLKKYISRWTAILMLIVWALPCQAAVKTRKVSMSLNMNSQEEAYSPDFCSNNEFLYCTWQEHSMHGAWNFKSWQAYVKKYNGTDWQVLGADSLNVNVDETASQPQIAIWNNGVTATWAENNYYPFQVYAKYYNGSSWSLMGSGGLKNLDGYSASQPDIQIINDQPYITWCEDKVAYGATKIYVKKFNGTDWEAVGGSCVNNPSNSGTYPKICAYKGVPYAAWLEYVDNKKTAVLFLKRFNGTAWESVDGGGLNLDISISENKSAYQICLKEIGESLYVTWRESSNIVVKRYNGTAWELLPPLIKISETYAASPILTALDQTIYLTWIENDNIYLQKFENGSWALFGASANSFNLNPNIHAQNPYLDIFHNELYLGWSEAAENASYPQIRIMTVKEVPPKSWPLTFTADKPVITFPNPAHTKVTFAFQETDGIEFDAEIYNMCGERIARIQQSDSTVAPVWECGNVASGVYTYRARTKTNGRYKKLGSGKIAIVR